MLFICFAGKRCVVKCVVGANIFPTSPLLLLLKEVGGGREGVEGADDPCADPLAKEVIAQSNCQPLQGPHSVAFNVARADLVIVILIRAFDRVWGSK